MDPKMHRYMQRIQKLMGTPNRSNTPIRPAKSPFRNRANNLDQYLKYELSSKIITKIIEKSHQLLVINFFNMIKNSEYRQKEKIYKFVAIERKQVKIDRGVAGKLMHAVLRQLIKNRFHHFVYNLPKEEEPSNFLYKKTNKQDAMRSVQLLRTTSKPQKSEYRQVSQWVDDVETTNQKADLIKKISNLKKYVSKTILKIIQQKYKRMLQQGYRSIFMCKRVSIPSQPVSAIKPQISSKLNKTSEETPFKSNDKSVNESSKIKNKEKILLIDQEDSKANYIFLRIAQKLMIKQKRSFIQNTKLLIRQALGDIKSYKQAAKISRYYKCAFKLDQFQKKYLKKYLYLIKKGKSQQQISKNAASVLILTQVIKKKIFQNEAAFLKALLLFSQSLQNKKSIFLQIQNVPDVNQMRSSISVESKLTLRKSSIISLNSQNPLSKLNFYTFVDKIFRLILIVSKLLIPLKQSFDKINQYALFSYDVENKFKSVSLKCLRRAFKEIKQYKTNDKNRGKLLNAASILQLAIQQKYVQAFSYIKILAKSREPSIKLYPIKSNIVEMTKQFIEERNMYSQHSFDYWNKVRQNILQDESVNSQRYNKGKRSIYTAI